MQIIERPEQITAGAARKHFDAIGKLFGRLTVRSVVYYERKQHPYMFKVSCVCGSELEVRPSSAYSGKVQSCGCRHKDAVSTSSGDTKPTNEFYWLYRFWVSVRYRTTKPTNPNYVYYASRAPTDPEWESYPLFKEQFIASFQQRFGRVHPLEGESLDRENNEERYSIANLRFASSTEQVRNRRTTKKTQKVDGTFEPIADIYDRLKTGIVSYQNFTSRFTRLGWTLAASLEVPESDVQAYCPLYSPPLSQNSAGSA